MKKIFTLLVVAAMLISAQTPIFATSVVDNDLSVKSVHLGGNTVGIALYTDGLYVTDTVPIENSDGKYVEVAAKAGIKKGDYLKKANGIELNDVSNLDAVLKASDGSDIKFDVLRENKMIEIKVKPIKAKNTGAYSIGLWLRDSAAGLGTVTYVDPENGEFAALGHSINDSDTGERLLLSKGRIVECVVTGVVKGKKGSAGELKGSFGLNARQIGVIKENSRFGLFGESSNIKKNELIQIGKKESVKIGEAYIYSDFENGQNKKYTVEILSINTSAKISEKNMVIKITDADLIAKTGGIVQGLSGSPVVQNGKLVGAVTHVLVNDPTRGYGIFIENMLSAAA